MNYISFLVEVTSNYNTIAASTLEREVNHKVKMLDQHQLHKLWLNYHTQDAKDLHPLTFLFFTTSAIALVHSTSGLQEYLLSIKVFLLLEYLPTQRGFGQLKSLLLYSLYTPWFSLSLLCMKGGKKGKKEGNIRDLELGWFILSWTFFILGKGWNLNQSKSLRQLTSAHMLLIGANSALLKHETQIAGIRLQ